VIRLASLYISSGAEGVGGQPRSQPWLRTHRPGDGVRHVAAFDGYRYFGLEAAANILEDITQRWDGGYLALDDAE
jgi:hypothetical protein